MAKSLLFLPDISGYTKFIQTTEIEHSQHVISELLEILIAANTEDLKLAEIEGDALFFYKEGEIPSQERLLAQIEAMFSAFYSHLELLKKNRICPCQACATAPNLELKVIAHAGKLQHIEVQGNRKPFGQQVIEAHRLMKNSISSDTYALISRALALEIRLSQYYSSKLFRFKKGKDVYDGKELEYLYSNIEVDQLQLSQLTTSKEVTFNQPPNLTTKKQFPLEAAELMEYISNLIYRKEWVKGVERFDYNRNEVTRQGTEHVCVVNGKHLNFVAVTKPAQKDQLVYGELNTDIPLIDKVYQFYVITPLTEKTCQLEIEVYWQANSLLKRMMMVLIGKKSFKRNMSAAINGLYDFVLTK